MLQDVPMRNVQLNTVTPTNTDGYYLDASATQKQFLSGNEILARRKRITASSNSLKGGEASTGHVMVVDALKRDLSPLRDVTTSRRSVPSGSVSYAQPLTRPSVSRRISARARPVCGNVSCADDERGANSRGNRPLSHLRPANTRFLSKKYTTSAADTTQNVVPHMLRGTRLQPVHHSELDVDSHLLLPSRVCASETPTYRDYHGVNVPLTVSQHPFSSSLISVPRESPLKDGTSLFREATEIPPRLASPTVLLDDCSGTIEHGVVSSISTTLTTAVSSMTIPDSGLSSVKIPPTPSTRFVNRDDTTTDSVLEESSSTSIIWTPDSKERSLEMSPSPKLAIHRNCLPETAPASLTTRQSGLSTISTSSLSQSHFSTKDARDVQENPVRGLDLSGEAGPISESPRRRSPSVRKIPRGASASAMAMAAVAASLVEAAAAEATTAAAVTAQQQQQPQQHNFTVLVAEVSDDGYDALVADIWVGVVLTLMVLSCVCCVCSCLLYHKFQQWKRSVLAARNGPVREATEGPYSAGDLESLPSYTIVSGLPSYEEALEQLRLARERRESLKSLGSQGGGDATPPAPPTPTAPVLVPASPPPQSALKLSVTEFFQMYKSYPPPV